MGSGRCLEQQRQHRCRWRVLGPAAGKFDDVVMSASLWGTIRRWEGRHWHRCGACDRDFGPSQGRTAGTPATALPLERIWNASGVVVAAVGTGVIENVRDDHGAGDETRLRSAGQQCRLARKLGAARGGDGVDGAGSSAGDDVGHDEDALIYSAFGPTDGNSVGARSLQMYNALVKPNDTGALADDCCSGCEET